MRKYTDITMLIDRSGSMNSIKESMEGAIRTFIKTHKKVPSSHFTLIDFDDIDPLHYVFRDRAIRDCGGYELIPRGNTPLLDSFAKAIDETGDRLRRMPSSERPDQVLFVVITDGQENCSRRFKRQDVFDRVTTQREQYNWQFTYLGANQDTFSEARSMGIPWVNTITYTPHRQYVGAMGQSLSSNTFDYANRDNTNISAYTNQQRNETATVADQMRANDPVTTTISTTNDDDGA